MSRARAWLRRRRAVIAVVALVVAIGGANMLWTAHEVQISQHRWCSTLTTLDDAAHGHPPATATGRRLFAGFVMLGGEFGCR